MGKKERTTNRPPEEVQDNTIDSFSFQNITEEVTKQPAGETGVTDTDVQVSSTEEVAPTTGVPSEPEIQSIDSFSFGGVDPKKKEETQPTTPMGAPIQPPPPTADVQALQNVQEGGLQLRQDLTVEEASQLQSSLPQPTSESDLSQLDFTTLDPSRGQRFNLVNSFDQSTAFDPSLLQKDLTTSLKQVGPRQQELIKLIDLEVVEAAEGLILARKEFFGEGEEPTKKQDVTVDEIMDPSFFLEDMFDVKMDESGAGGVGVVNLDNQKIGILDGADARLNSALHRRNQIMKGAVEFNRVAQEAYDNNQRPTDYVNDQKDVLVDELTKPLESATLASKIGDAVLGQDEYYPLVGEGYKILDKQKELLEKRQRPTSNEEEIDAELTTLSKEFEKNKTARFDSLNGSINDIKNTLREGVSDPIKKFALEEEIEYLERLKQNVFEDDPEKVIKNVTASLSSDDIAVRLFDMLPDDLTAKEKFDQWYYSMYRRNRSLGSKIEALNPDGTFTKMSQGVRARDFFGSDLSADEQEFFETEAVLRELTPVFFLNNFGVRSDEQGFMSSAGDALVKWMTPTQGRLTNTLEGETARNVANEIKNLGISDSQINTEALDAVVSRGEGKQLLGEGFNVIDPTTWDNFKFNTESGGEIVGITSGAMAELASGGAMFKLLGSVGRVQKAKKLFDAFSALEKSGKAKNAINAFNKTILQSPKYIKWLKEPVRQGLKFEVTGEMFSQHEDEFNFMAGFLGGFFGDRTKGVVDKALNNKATRGAMNTIARVFGDKSEDAVALMQKFGARAKDFQSRGFGEVAEEFTQEAVGVWRESSHAKEFFAGMRDRFGSMSDLQEFVISSYVMGAGFGLVSNSKTTNDAYNELTPDQKRQVGSVIDDIQTEFSKATSNMQKEMAKDPEAAEQMDLFKEGEVKPGSKESFAQKGVDVDEKGNITGVSGIGISKQTAKTIDKTTSEGNTETFGSQDTEYKINEGFFSEQEFIESLNEEGFATKVKAGEVEINLQEPSNAVVDAMVENELINPTQAQILKTGTDAEITKEAETETDVKTEAKPEAKTEQEEVLEPETEGEVTEKKPASDQPKETKTTVGEQVKAQPATEVKGVNNLTEALKGVQEGVNPLSNPKVFDASVNVAQDVFNEGSLKGKALDTEIATRISDNSGGAITLEDAQDIVGELRANIVKSPKLPKQQVVNVSKEKSKKAADFLRGAKVSFSEMGTLQSSPLPIFEAAINTSIEATAKAIEATGAIAGAIETGVKALKATEWYKGLSDGGKSKAEEFFKNNAAKQFAESEEFKEFTEDVEDTKGPEEGPKTEPTEEVDTEEEAKGQKAKESEPEVESDPDAVAKEVAEETGAKRKERSLPKNVSEDIKKGLEKNAETYIPISNTITVAEAEAIIEAKGLDQAKMDVLNFKNKLSLRTRVAMAAVLKDEFKAKGDLASSIEISNKMAQFATELGQAVQAFALFNKDTFDEIVKSYGANLDVARAALKERKTRLYQGTKSGYKTGTERAAAKATKKVAKNKPKAVKETTTMGLSKSDIDKKLSDSLAKFKKNAGKDLTTGGLNKEAIEALGEYGFYLFLKGINTFQAWSAQMRRDTGIEDEAVLKRIWHSKKTEAVVDKVWNNKDNIAGDSLNEMTEIPELSQVVTDHYTQEGEGPFLAQKLKDVFNLSGKQANDLAREIDKEFQKIAEKERKIAIKKDAGVVANKKTIAAIDDIASKNNLTDSEIEEIIEESYGIKSLTEAQLKDIKQIADERDVRPDGRLKTEKTVEMLTYMNNLDGISKGELMWSFWYASILSGPKTQLLNVTANALNAGAEFYVTMIEKGMVDRDPAAIAAGVQGYWKGLGRGIIEGEEILKKGNRTGKTNFKLEGKDALERFEPSNVALKPLKVAKFVGRALDAVDTASTMAGRGGMLNKIAREVAIKEGLSGEKLRIRTSEILSNSTQEWEDAKKQAAKDVEAIEKAEGKMGVREKSRMTRLRAEEIIDQSIDEEITQTASNYGEFIAFNYRPQGVLGVISDGIIAGSRKLGALRLIVPFTGVVANVLNQQLDWTPYGILRGMGFNSHLLTKGGTRSTQGDTRSARVRQIIKGATGLTMMIGLYAMFSVFDDDEDPELAITGKGPSDFKKRNQLLSQGWKPYSIKVGDTYISYKFSTQALALSFIGNWKDNEKYKSLDKEAFSTKAVHALQSSSRGIMDMSFLTGLSSLMNALSSEGNPENETRRTLKATARTATSFIPNFFKQLDKAWFDDTIYDNETLGASILRDIPFARSYAGLRPKLNAFGQPIEVGKDPFLTKRFFSDITKDPVWLLMGRKRSFVPGASDETKLKDGSLMTTEEFYDYIKISGQETYNWVKENMSWLENESNNDFQKRLKKNIQSERKKAKKIISRNRKN